MFTEITLIDHRRSLAERRRARRSCGPYRWRPCPPDRGRGFYIASDSDDRVDEAGSSFRLRFQPARDYRRGAGVWRGDHGLDAWTPIVARLNRGRGFLAGASLGRGMLAFLDPEIFDCAIAAAMAADDAAQRQAEADMKHCKEEEA